MHCNISECTADLYDWEEGEDSLEVTLAHDGEGGGYAGGATILQRQL